MPVEIRCGCGQAMRVPESAVGRRVRCPACQRAVAVPRAAEDSDDIPWDELVAMERTAGEETEPQPGSRPDGRFACPDCGRRVRRGAARCSACGLSLRMGTCSICGGKLFRGHCRRCRGNRLPIAWRDDDRVGLCMNCGNTIRRNFRILVPGTWSRPFCGRCAADELIDELPKSVLTDTFLSTLDNQAASQGSPDKLRIRKLTLAMTEVSDDEDDVPNLELLRIPRVLNQLHRDTNFRYGSPFDRFMSNWGVVILLAILAGIVALIVTLITRGVFSK